MNTSTGNPAVTAVREYHNSRRSRPLWDIRFTAWGQIALVAFGSTVLAMAITRQSLWIDEAWTAWYAAHPSVLSLLHAVVQVKSGDAQMPGYLLYMHAWVMLFGRDEITLRIANIPFAVLLLSSLSWVSTVLLNRPYAWLVVTLSPFLWFYMNEARPYIVLMATSSVIAAAALAYCMDQCRYNCIAPWVAMASLTAAFAFHMLAAFLGVTVLFFLLLSTKGQWGRLVSDWRRPVLVFLPLIATISVYYTWTVLVGAGGTRAETGLRNTAFVFYEFCGFGGLGPPRNDLRAIGGTGLIAYWPLLMLGCAALLSILALVIITSHRKLDRDFALSVAVGFVFAVLVCKAVHFRFVGRHLAAFYPFGFLMLLLNTREQGKVSRHWAVAGAFTLLAIAWVVSDARLLMPIYGKDDYRGAAAVALDRARPNGRAILWVADGVAAYYYGLKAHERFNIKLIGNPSPFELNWPVSGRVVLASNWTSAQVCNYVKGSGGPIILVLGRKPDLFDQNGAWASLTRQPNAHATRIATRNNFEIYDVSLGR